MKKLLKESSLTNNLQKLKKDYNDAVIVFHQDFDGVLSGIAMREVLKNAGFKVVGAHVIQYGDKEWTLKKSNPESKTMYVLVDFAHGKPMFQVHTDHHDTQAGVEPGTTTDFRSKRSNVETINDDISMTPIFSKDDIIAASTIDSADFARHNVTPEEVMRYFYQFEKESDMTRNRMLLGFVTNKLMLAFKNKPGFMEKLVMTCQPSLVSIFTTIKNLMKENVKGTKYDWASQTQLEKNKEDYLKTMKNYPKMKVDNSIILQYGGGSMINPGSYDRYTAFRNNPEADFFVMGWPMGMVQASCNPFKENREMKGVNLGQIAKEVLSKYESGLKNIMVPISTIKWVSEFNKEFSKESVGFTFKDLIALYGNQLKNMEDGKENLYKLAEIMDKSNSELIDEEWKLMDEIKISAWDIIMANSGGHKCITNISGLTYIGRGKRPPKGGPRYGDDDEDSLSVKYVKEIAKEFYRVLKGKIEQSKA